MGVDGLVLKQYLSFVLVPEHLLFITYLDSYISGANVLILSLIITIAVTAIRAAATAAFMPCLHESVTLKAVL